MHLRIELLGLAKIGVLLVDHDVAATGHVLLVQTLDVENDVVTGLCLLCALVVHHNTAFPDGTKKSLLHNYQSTDGTTLLTKLNSVTSQLL